MPPDPPPRARHTAVALTLLVLATVLLQSCSDNTGPGPQRSGFFAVTPRFASASAGIVPIGSVRFLVTRVADGSVAKDTVVVVAPGADTVGVAMTVPLLVPGEEFAVVLKLITPQGDTAFSGGPVTVTPSVGDETPAIISPTLVYVGVGSNAAGITILTADTAVFQGEALLLSATAHDAANAPIPGTPVAWRSLDTAIVRVVRPDSGRVMGTSQRGVARIVAELLTGQADTVLVSNQPLPAAIVAESGSDQSALADSALPQPLVARLTAGDGLGVGGLWVRFAVTSGGGTLSADSVRTDSTGRAAVQYTLARSFQPHVITATTARLGTASAAFNATLLFLPAAALEIVAGDAQTAVAGSAVATAPQVRVLDVDGLPVPGLTVTFTVTGGGGIVSGGTPVTDTLGLGTATSWALGTTAGANTLRASVDTLAVTFTATGVPGPAARLAFTAEPSDVSQDSVIAPPVAVTVFDAFDNLAVGYGGAVQLALFANPGGATLNGSLSRSAVTGVATFDDLSLSAAGVGYTLSATATGLTPDTSAAFDVLASARQVRWINASGGNWGTPANWDKNRVPAAEDTVVIDLAGSYVVGVTSNAVAANLRTGGAGSTPTLRIASANLTVADGFANAGAIVLTNSGVNEGSSLTVTTGTLLNTGTITTQSGSGGIGGRTITATIDNQGTLTAESYQLTISNGGRTFTSTAGTLAVPSGQTLLINGGTAEFGSGTVITGNGTVRLPANAALVLPSDFTLAAGDYRLDLAGGSGMSVAGPGTFTVEDTLTLTADTINAPLLLTGRLEVREAASFLNGQLAIVSTGLLRIGGSGGSALTVADGFTNGGTILLTNDGVNAGASLAVVNGTLLNTGFIEATNGSGGVGGRTITATIDNEATISATSYNLTISNAGRTFTSSSGTLATPNGNTITLSGGTVQLGAETVLSGRGTVSLPSNTTLDLTSDFTLVDGDYRLDLAGANGITVNGPGGLTVQDTLVLTADTINAPFAVSGRVEARGATSFINGTMSIGTGALLRIGDPGSTALTVANGFTNDGTILLTNDGVNAAATLSVTSGTLVNDGLIEATAGSGGVGGRTVNATILNAGTLSATSFRLTVANAGRVFNTQGGALTTPNGQTLTLSGGTVQVGSSTILSGTGVFSLPSNTTLEVASDFTLAAADYRLDLAGGNGISINGPGIFTMADTLVLAGDTVNAPLVIAGRVEVRGSPSRINGALSIQPGGFLRIGDPGTTSVTVAAGFTNAGDILLTNDGVNASAGLTVSSGTLINTGTITSAPNVGGGPATMTLATALDHRGTITLNYPLAGLGQLTIPAAASASVIGNGTTLSVTGLDVDGATFDNAPLVSTGGTITRFDNATFQNMSTSAIQLTINHPGAATPFTFTGVSFLTTPTTGKYIRANDQTTGDAGLVINMEGSTPADGSAYEDEVNGAVINWVLPPPPPPITFAGDSSGGASSGVFSMNGDGTSRARLFDASFTGSDYFHPRWAPDRSRIAFGLEAAGAPIHMLEVVSADGQETAAVVSDQSIRYPRWSPDGQHLVYACGTNSLTPYDQWQVCIVSDATGSVSSLAGRGNSGGGVVVSAFDLVNRPNGIPAFTWNPTNSNEMAFIRDSTGASTSSRIYVATFSGGTWNVTPLSPDVMDLGDGPLKVESNWLDWSPDGQTLTFAASDPTSGIGHIYTIGQDGNGLTQLTSGSDWDDSPLWSPTGTEILFSRDQSCSLDAWIMASDGSAQRQASAESVCDYNTERLGYDWSPDGQEIVLTGFDQSYGNLLIFTILRTTTSATYFTDRVLIGRGASVVGSGEVVDIQPSWRP